MQLVPYKEIRTCMFMRSRHNRSDHDFTPSKQCMQLVCSIVSYFNGIVHKRTRNCGIPSLILNTPSCRSSTFQSSFFNRNVPLWNRVCKMASQSDLRSLIMFKSFLSRTYSNLLVTCFDVDMTCTWSLHRSCSCHRY